MKLKGDVEALQVENRTSRSNEVLSISIGSCIRKPMVVEDPWAVVHCADEDLYEDKGRRLDRRMSDGRSD